MGFAVKRHLPLLVLLSFTLTFAVVFAQDSTPPSVRITYSPSEIGSLTIVTYTATASDAGGLANVKIYVDSALKTTCTGSPCTFIGGPYAAGTTHTFYATAEDTSGNTGTSIPQQPVSNLDYAVISLDVSGNTEEGSELTISAVVKNIGSASIPGSFSADMMIDYNNDNPSCNTFDSGPGIGCNAYIGSVEGRSFSNLAPGQSMTISGKWNASCAGFLPPCTHRIRFRADPYRILRPPAFPNGDRDYANNYLTRLITINPPPAAAGVTIGVSPASCTVSGWTSCPVTINWSALGYPNAGVRAYETIKFWESKICNAGEFSCRLNMAPGNYVLKVFENADSAASRLLAQATLVVTQAGVVIAPPPAPTGSEPTIRAAKFINWVVPASMNRGQTKPASITLKNCEPWSGSYCGNSFTYTWTPEYWKVIAPSYYDETSQRPVYDLHVAAENDIYSFEWGIGQILTPIGTYVEGEVSSLIRWDGTRWNTVPNTGSGIRPIRVGGNLQYISASEIYTAGTFYEPVTVMQCIFFFCYPVQSEALASGIVKWDGSWWTKVLNVTGYTLWDFYVVSDSNVYAILTPTGAFSNTLYHWDGLSWTQLSNAELLRTGLEYQGGNVYAADSSGRVARWDGSSWTAITPTSFSVSLFDFVSESSIYASGTGTIGGSSFTGIARWNGAQWEPVYTASPYALHYNGELYPMTFAGVEKKSKYYYLDSQYDFWGPTTADLPNAVGMLDTVTLSFNITAPPTAGTYSFQWKMFGDRDFFSSASTFNEPTPLAAITVTP